MLRASNANRSLGQVSPLYALRRCSRSIEVKVFEDGLEVDRFTVTSPEVLRSELRTIYKFLPRGRSSVELTGVEEQWFPLGLDRTRSETGLKNSADALFFLAA